jgi:acetate---CoA ligase (ADP-forming)
MRDLLEHFFRPRAIAVIGASREPGKLGYDVLRNLLRDGYPGDIYPVNPNAGIILELECYPTIDAVPEPPDLVILVLPAPAVPGALEACGTRGVRAVTIFSGGFRETGAAGAALEEDVIAIAERWGIALLGPNCIGTMDTHAGLNATFVRDYPATSDIAFVSQSGAMATAVIDYAKANGYGLSRVASVGNQAGLREVDLLVAAAQDEHTQAVTMYIEGVSDGPEFLRTALTITREKPIVVLKGGRGAAGARAVQSHTGSIAGQDRAYDAAFAKSGVLRAGSLREMMDWARTLSWQPPLRGSGLAILTNAGGLGVMAADSVEAAGLTVATLSEQTVAGLRAFLPPAASAANPVDILAGSQPALYARCLSLLLADENVNSVVVITAPQDWFAYRDLADVLAQSGFRERGKPVLANLMGIDAAGRESLDESRIPNLALPEDIGGAFAALRARHAFLLRNAQAVPEDSPSPAAVPSTPVSTASEWLGPEAASDLLAEAGIQAPAYRVVGTGEEAVHAAEEVGLPVALKLVTEAVTHKADVGGVVLGLAEPSVIRAAAERLLQHPGARVLVQRMVPGGVEAIIGMVRDPVFGPLMMIGTGGGDVELVQDVAFGLAPLTVEDATRLLERTKLAARLAGYRGAMVSDQDALLQALVSLADVALQHPRIQEIEINPLFVLPGGDGVLAADVRVRSLLPGSPAAG